MQDKPMSEADARAYAAYFDALERQAMAQIKRSANSDYDPPIRTTTPERAKEQAEEKLRELDETIRRNVEAHGGHRLIMGNQCGKATLHGTWVDLTKLEDQRQSRQARRQLRKLALFATNTKLAIREAARQRARSARRFKRRKEALLAGL